METTHRRRALVERRVFPYLVVLVFCSLVDWALTTDALIMGIARESNPAMMWMAQEAHGLSFAVKLAVPLVGGLLLYALRADRYARLGVKLLAATYGALVLYHIIGRLFIV